MSITSLMTDIKTKIFGFDSDKPRLAKIMPKFDDEYIPDLEVGEGGFYRRIKERQMALESYSKSKNWDKSTNWDPEKSDKAIICGEISVDIDGYEKCRVIEDYVSFTDFINYFSKTSSQREPLTLPFFVEEKVICSDQELAPSHITIDMTSNEFDGVSLNLDF